MGVDIHMAIYKDGKYEALDFPYVRNTEFFDRFSGRNDFGVYSRLPRKYNYPDVEGFEDAEYCYGFFALNAGDVRKWYDQYKPDEYAGYVRRYDKWLYETKGISPYEYLLYLEEEDAANRDWVWLEWNNPNDMINWFMDIIKDMPDEQDILIYFDC